MSPPRPGKPPSDERRPARARARADRPEIIAPGEEAGVLSNLPSTRPQHPSARRASARRSPSRTAATPGRANTATPHPANTATPRRANTATPHPANTATPRRAGTPDTTGTPQGGAPTKAKAKRPAKPAGGTQPAQAGAGRRRTSQPTPPEPRVPRQGFASEEEIELGRPVQPPSGTDLAASLAELVGELAQAGVSAGGRLLKDALTRLSG
jgi:hypothetical protein